jgi:hypothetical protein
VSEVEEVAEFERRKWAELWALPQALEWSRIRDFGTPALYVRVFTRLAFGAADAKLLSELRRLDGMIGLSWKALRDMRCEIDDPEVEQPVVSPVRRIVVGE